MNSLFENADDSAPKNTWKYLTVAAASFVMVAVLYLGWIFLIPGHVPMSSAAYVPSTLVGSVFAGIFGIVLIVAIPILAILIPAIIVGFGFGIGFGASGIGRDLRRRG